MKKLSLVSVLVFFLAVIVNAQETTVSHDITVKFPTYAFVGLSDASDIKLSPAAPTVAGKGLDFDVASATSSTKYLQYSSLKGKNNGANKIVVSMQENEVSLPSGVAIRLKVDDYDGNGKGSTGTSIASVTGVVLSSEGKAIVTGIKNCYTGEGSSDGHLLTYSLEMADATGSYDDLATGDYSVTITYTIEAE